MRRDLPWVPAAGLSAKVSGVGAADENEAGLARQAPFRALTILHVSCTSNEKAAPTSVYPLVRTAFAGWA
jgi:hypothetical protein